MSTSRKRKHPARSHHYNQGIQPEPYQSIKNDDDEAKDPLRGLYIQAYEADILRGPTAKSSAQSLEPPADLLGSKSREQSQFATASTVGFALIRWGENITYGHESDANSPDLPPGEKHGCSPIWVDRYDARLLLDALPDDSESFNLRPSSPTGWSDLPSDTEDNFFFTANEIEDFQREKRRKLIEHAREERLKARMEEDGVQDEPHTAPEDVWGGSDEEPDEAQSQLMRRTATHLHSSPNPAQLEMRILANHGGDRRFAFLRGRWSRAWNLMKVKERQGKEKQEGQPKATAGINLLGGYGSEDSEDNEEVDETAVAHVEHSKQVTEELAREARRIRAKEWAEARRMEKAKRSE